MRGVSALGEVLGRHRDARVAVIVVWEDVVETDLGPPSEKDREPLRDPRVSEWFDAHGWLSQHVNAARAEQAKQTGEAPPAPDDVAWDFIARYDPGARWSDPFPIAAWHDEPVVSARDELDAQLAAAR